MDTSSFSRPRGFCDYSGPNTDNPLLLPIDPDASYRQFEPRVDSDPSEHYAAYRQWLSDPSRVELCKESVLGGATSMGNPSPPRFQTC